VINQEVLIVPYQDGPYLVRGPVVMRDQDGRQIEIGRRTIALCRCGKSRMRPFCDGTHRLVRFQACSQPETPWPEDPVIPLSTGKPSTAQTSSGRPGSSGLAWSDETGPHGRAGGQDAPIGPGKLVTARKELEQAKERLAGLLENNSHTGREHVAICAAEPLVETAWLLLDTRGRNSALAQSGSRETGRLRAPCACLVRGALGALAPIVSGVDEPLRKLIAQLMAVLVLLEPDPEW
jgi:CDGSH-type Zn-finger protein